MLPLQKKNFQNSVVKPLISDQKRHGPLTTGTCSTLPIVVIVCIPHFFITSYFSCDILTLAFLYDISMQHVGEQGP